MLRVVRVRALCVVLKGIICGIGIITLATNFVGCGKETVTNREGEGEMSSKTIEQVLEEYTDRIMSVDGVVGTGIGECDGQPCIKVYVVKKTRELEEQIPATLEGYPVSIQETGEIKALDDGG